MDIISEWNNSLTFLLDTDTIINSIVEDATFFEIDSINEASLKEFGGKVVEGIKTLWDKVKTVVSTFIDAVARYFGGSKFYKLRAQMYSRKYIKPFMTYCLDRSNPQYVLKDNVTVCDKAKLLNTGIYTSIENKLKENQLKGSDTIIYDLFGYTLGLKNKETSLDELKTYLDMYFIKDVRGKIIFKGYNAYISKQEDVMDKLQETLKTMGGSIDSLFKKAIKDAEVFAASNEDKDQLAQVALKASRNLVTGMKATSLVIGEHIRAIKTYMKDFREVDNKYWGYIDELANKYRDEFFDDPKNKQYNSKNIDVEVTPKEKIKESAIYNF